MKIIYEVDGEQYDTLEEAQEAEELANSVRNKEILMMANSFHEIFTMIQAISAIPENNNLAEAKIAIKDRKLLPNYYVSKVYYTILVKLLKEKNVPYSAKIVEEHSDGTLEIYTPNSKIENVPSVAIFEIYIKEYLEKEELK